MHMVRIVRDRMGEYRHRHQQTSDGQSLRNIRLRRINFFFFSKRFGRATVYFEIINRLRTYSVCVGNGLSKFIAIPCANANRPTNQYARQVRHFALMGDETRLPLAHFLFLNSAERRISPFGQTARSVRPELRRKYLCISFKCIIYFHQRPATK